MVALPGLLMRQFVVSDVILVSLLSPLFWSCFENGGMLPWELCCCVSSVVQYAAMIRSMRGSQYALNGGSHSKIQCVR